MPSLDWNSDRYKNIGKDETCNEDIVKTSLTNTDFLKIVVSKVHSEFWRLWSYCGSQYIGLYGNDGPEICKTV